MIDIRNHLALFHNGVVSLQLLIMVEETLQWSARSCRIDPAFYVYGYMGILVTRTLTYTLSWFVSIAKLGALMFET